MQHSPFAHGLGSLHFTNGTAPIVAKMSIFNGASLADAKFVHLSNYFYDHHDRVPDMPAKCYNGNCSLISVTSVQCKKFFHSLSFSFSAEGIIYSMLDNMFYLVENGTNRSNGAVLAELKRTIAFGDRCEV